MRALRTKVCADCGKSYETYGTRSFYCPDCSEARKRIARAECRKRKAAGKTRPIGSKDICERCGAEYTVEGGLQRYCPDCAKKRTNEYCLERFYNGGAEQSRARTDSRAIATANCIVCGKPFLLDGARDKCCSEECLRIRARQLTALHYQEHTEQYKERWQQWYAENKEEYLEKKKSAKKSKEEST